MKLRSTIVLALSITCYLANGQDADWRTVTGTVTHEGEPMIGETVLILGTVNGTITDRNSKFCLLAPVDESIFISMPQCFSEVVRELDIETKAINIKLNRKNKRLSDKAWTAWKLQKGELEPRLKNLFGAFNYQNQLAEICR